jgi:hypothetical protein
MSRSALSSIILLKTKWKKKEQSAKIEIVFQHMQRIILFSHIRINTEARPVGAGRKSVAT